MELSDEAGPNAPGALLRRGHCTTEPAVGTKY